MRCMYCNCPESKVLDSRTVEDGASIRRRRECVSCGRRFTTYEKVEAVPLLVIKRDGSREPFSREKLMNGIMTSCEKLPISIGEITAIVDRIERKAYQSDAEVSTQFIGDLVMSELRGLNEVAYVRFAAVYHKFTDLTAFMEELQRLVDDQKRGV